MKQTIQVNVLLIAQGPITHIELLLKNPKDKTYYSINRWGMVSNEFSPYGAFALNEAYYNLAFDIQACPDEIIKKWRDFYTDTTEEAFILGHNCGVSAQWFLTEFCDIPAPGPLSLPITYDQALSFIHIPSYLPLPGSDRLLVLPCRIASNAEFYVNARKNPKLYTQYTAVFLNVCLAVWALTLAASITGIVLATMFLTGGLAIGIVAASVLLGTASTSGLFSNLHARKAKAYVENLHVSNDLERTPLMV